MGAITSPAILTKLKMMLKAILLCHLVLTPTVFSFSLPSPFIKADAELEERQFSDEPLINYGIWGFIAGLSDYFIRQALTATTTTTTWATTTTTTTTTVAPRRRNKNNKTKKNKNKRKKTKGKKADRIVEVPEAEPIIDAVTSDDSMTKIVEDAAEETVEQEAVVA